MRFFGLLFAFIILTIAKETFHDHKVVRIQVQSQHHLNFLYDQFLNNVTLDFWIEPGVVGRNVDLRLSPDQWTWFSEELNSRGIPHYTFIENVQELLDRQLQRNEGVTTSFGDIDFSVYHTYEEIIEWVKSLPVTYPDLVTLVTIGHSYEGRELLAVKIRSNRGPADKPAIWFNGGIHAREWISPATVIYMLGHLLEDYDTDDSVTRLIDGLEIFVLPVFNTDGYVFTWSGNRMWRKTRTPNPGSTCIGTDPNRNWDFEWGGAGTSPLPCSDSYHGPRPFSEIEVSSVGLFIANAGNFKGYIDFHAYGQLWMSPWGYTAALPQDHNLLNLVNARCANAIASVHGTQYRYGPIATTIYLASGSSVDYTYNAGVLYSFAVELRDTGAYGFVLPPNQIIPSGEETYEALKLWAGEVLNSNP